MKPRPSLDQHYDITNWYKKIYYFTIAFIFRILRLANHILFGSFPFMKNRCPLHYQPKQCTNSMGNQIPQNYHTCVHRPKDGPHFLIAGFKKNTHKTIPLQWNPFLRAIFFRGPKHHPPFRTDQTHRGTAESTSSGPKAVKGTWPRSGPAPMGCYDFSALQASGGGGRWVIRPLKAA